MSDDQNRNADSDDLDYDMAREDEDYFDDLGTEEAPADEEPAVRIQDIQDVDDDDDAYDDGGNDTINEIADAEAEDDVIVPAKRTRGSAGGKVPRKSAMLIIGGVAVLALLGGGAMMLMGGGDSAPSPDTQVPLPPGQTADMAQNPGQMVPMPGQDIPPGTTMPGQPPVGTVGPDGLPLTGAPQLGPDGQQIAGAVPPAQLGPDGQPIAAADPNALPPGALPADPNALPPGALPADGQPPSGAVGPDGQPLPGTPPQPATIANTPPDGTAPAAPVISGTPTTVPADQVPPPPATALPSAPSDVIEEVPSTDVAGVKDAPKDAPKSDGKDKDKADDASAADDTEPEIADADAPSTASDEYYDTGTIVNDLADLGPKASEYVVVNKVSEGSPSSTLTQMGAKALASGRYGAAVDIYGDALIRSPSDVTALLGRAIANQKLGNNDAAIRDYEKVLTISPQNKEAQLNLSGLVMTKEPGLVSSKLASLQEQYPDNGGVAAQKALILAGQGNIQQAAAQMDVAITLEPQNPMHYYNRAILAERMNDKARAIQNYERALDIDTVYAGGRKVPREKIYDRLFVLRN